MQTPVQVTFLDAPVDDAVEAACIDEAENLERFFARITSCRVAVRWPRGRHRKGNRVEVKIQLEVPGEVLAIENAPGPDAKPDDAFAAVADAFHIARRRLEDYVRIHHGDVKKHSGSAS